MMEDMVLKILGADGEQKAACTGERRIDMVYAPRYKKGDLAELAVANPGFYEICLEDTMPPAIVYIEKTARFAIPFGRAERVAYSPRSFKGRQHFLSARKADEPQIYARRNLAFNPYDRRGETGMFPRAASTVGDAEKSLFAARNAINGVCLSDGHYPWPYQSWGINKDPEAALTVDFGVPVTIDELVLTLRTDFPHDSYWTSATTAFSDGSRETLSLQKTSAPQRFPIEARTVTSVTLQELIKAEDESPFPALTQIEAWGTVAR